MSAPRCNEVGKDFSRPRPRVGVRVHPTSASTHGKEPTPPRWNADGSLCPVPSARLVLLPHPPALGLIGVSTSCDPLSNRWVRPCPGHAPNLDSKPITETPLFSFFGPGFVRDLTPCLEDTRTFLKPPKTLYSLFSYSTEPPCDPVALNMGSTWFVIYVRFGHISLDLFPG